MNAYQILGVEPTASDAEIREAYRALAKQHHPDKKGGDAEQFKEVQRAYDKVGTPSARAAYDAGTEPVTADEINSILLKSFRAAISEDPHSRVLPRIFKFLNQEKRKHSDRVKHAESEVKFLQANRKRLTTKNDVPNMFEEAVDSTIDGHQTAIKQHQEAIRGITEVYQFLVENYEEGSVVYPPTDDHVTITLGAPAAVVGARGTGNI